jgi:retinol-binding protein 3
MRTHALGRTFVAVLTVAAALLAVAGAQQGPAPEPPAVAAADRTAIVEDLLKGLNETYVFPDVAEKMVQHVRARLAAGAYDGDTNLRDFCERLTEDLQSISHDKHLRVRWAPRRPDEGESEASAKERRARELAEMERDNFCFEKIERLPGNVGYLKFNCFASADVAGPTAVAAMNFLGHSDALIFDLRDNGGGDPTMIQLITSYLLAEPKHLNSFYIRKSGATDQFWSHAYVSGPRLPDAPVFVLTSSYTFSGAEEFSYNLKNLKRGTIVGETTGGGAHPVESYRVKDYPVVAMLPFGRAINPISGTNWEGTGVAPDIAVPVAAALDTAYVKALETLAERAADEEQKRSLVWLREGLEATLKPFAVSDAALRSYVGSYGPRRITLENGALYYQREARPKFKLVPMADGLFVAPDLDYFRISFERGPDGKLVRLVGIYEDGRRDGNDRTD